MSKSIAIVGTAETWREAPWKNESVEIWTLNDAYMLGMPRIDVMFEMHPLDRFVFRNPQTKLTIQDIPFGHYVRPEGHLEWMKKFAQTKRVWLQGDCPSDWPEARTFPRKELCEKYHDLLFPDPTWHKEYVASGPFWMMLLALDQGATEIIMTGIHLATQREYIDQRPNMEYLIGYARGKGVQVHLPKGTPICKTTHVYCYEPRLTMEQDRIRSMIQNVDQKRSTLIHQVVQAKPWRRTASLKREIDKLERERHELAHELQRIDLQDALSRPEWRVQ